MSHDQTPSLQTTTLTESPSSHEAPPEAPRAKQRRGFAVMNPQIVAAIASKGGKAAHAAGTAHEFSADEAREAGRKGGLAPHQKRRSSPKPNA